MVQQAETTTTVCEWCGAQGDPLVIAYCCRESE